MKIVRTTVDKTIFFFKLKNKYLKIKNNETND